MTLRRLAITSLLLALTVVGAGCGERVEPTAGPTEQPLRLMLDYLPNADHAGIYAADAEGDFAKAGLNVDIQTPSDPSAPLKLLAAGKVDFAISYEPELMLARDKGQDLVAVGALVQKPLTSIMSVGKDGIKDPAQLKGKTVGTAGIPYQSAYLKAILARANVDASSVKEVNVGFNLVPAMLSGRVDATLGAFWNVEGVQLALDKRRPRILPVDRAGVPAYDELVLVARRTTVRKDGALIRRFIQALGRGTASARRDPAAGVDALLEAVPDLKRDFATASVRATLPALLENRSGKPFGWQDLASWQAYIDWMVDNKLLARPLAAGAVLTNEFLPGEGVGESSQTP